MRSRSWVVVLGLLAGATPDAGAQDRSASVAEAQRAYEMFDLAGAQSALQGALNPTLGRPDTVWARGVQLLVQVLLEQKNDSLAAAWSRWAARLDPDFPVDSIVYTPPTVAAVLAGRAATQPPSPDDSVTTTSWEWPTAPARDLAGAVLVTAGPASLEVLIAGVGLATRDRPMSLEPGSYAFVARADSFETARVSREVLPGVTTVLGFSLRPAAPAVATAEPPPPGVTPRQPSGGSPRRWIIIGAAGIGAAAAILIGTGGGGPGGSGGITSKVPVNP